ncbi:MAG: molybdopterin cofactor-binding domain-containing protein [Rhodothermales bacterium]|nr:molybdopterin cofactor-binding domain-containing protein [Rhodothermales bacterium]
MSQPAMNTTINRRSFLKASALTGGGLMIGFNWFAGCQPAIDPLAPVGDWSEINAFLKIAENGIVTIMSPNPEIGQNVKTSMPMIVAEELDVDWKHVIVEQAGLDTVKFSRQLAGGSDSIRQSWAGLRKAGATARHMLVDAAAQRLEVPASELTTSAGVITHAGSKRSVGYGEVASAAALLPVPENPTLKEAKDFTIVGTSRKNVDAPKIVQGEPLYGMDFKRDGMLIAMIEHPPAFGMTVKSVDATAAKAMPGIVDVITVNTRPDGFQAQWMDVTAFPELVVVLGRSTWEVMKAKKALTIEWETTSRLENSAEQSASLAGLLTGRTAEVARRDGNPEAAFRNAAKVIDRTYSAPFLAHNTMEPMNFFAHVTADRAELIGPIQTPEALRKSVSQLLSMPEENITIALTRMGGGFGRRLYGNFGMEAAAISKVAGAPIKLIYSREDDMTQGTYRPAYQVRYRAALDANNNLIAFHVRGAGISESPVFANRFPAGTVDNYLAENVVLESNVSTGAWRAPRSNFIAGAEQAFIDEVAEAAGKDPIAFRLELFDRAMTNPVGTDNDYDPARMAGVLKLARDKSGWDATPAGVARGVSVYYCHNSYVAQVLDLTMNGNQPIVDKVWCAVDCGIVVNPDAALNQIEGGIVDGIGHAMYGAITIADGRPEQRNFDTYSLIRNTQAPKAVEAFFVDNGIDPTGLGEPSLPPVSGALANAIAKATGKRLYSQPFAPALEGLELPSAVG